MWRDTTSYWICEYCDRVISIQDGSCPGCGGPHRSTSKTKDDMPRDIPRTTIFDMNRQDVQLLPLSGSTASFINHSTSSSSMVSSMVMGNFGFNLPAIDRHPINTIDPFNPGIYPYK